MISGVIHKFGDHVDTDVILPGRYLTLRDPAELAKHCLEGLDPTFASRVRSGDLVVAGRNFGSGSSREHAPIALKAAGVGCVIAASFARIFYRNAINIGLPLITCPDFARDAENGRSAQIDMTSGRIDYQNRTYHGEGLPEAIRVIVDAGGLVPYVRQRISPPTLGADKD
jgi:3-isopropylmalate/(R)-2-methylmalate dehydratase small subunit